eukprot:gene6259-6330_t
MVATIAAGTSAEYYVNCADYYLGGKEPVGHWIAIGIDADICVGSPVERASFQQLHAGFASDGRNLLTNKGGQPNRVGGYDVTFSAPKSCSVLWGLADDKMRARIEKAQANAVATAIEMLERNAAFTRSGKNGIHRHKARLTVAAFQHGEARPATHEDGKVFADCALHTHVVILNLAEKPQAPKPILAGNDQIEPEKISYGALDGKALFSWKMAAGATYHAELARNLQNLGFAVGEIGKNGMFEVEGVDAELRQYFSARRAEIEDELTSAGTSSGSAPALAAAIAKATRKSKQEFTGEDRFSFWQARSESLGFSPAELLDVCLQAGREQSEKLNDPERARLLEQNLAAIPRQLTEHESFFERRQLHAAIASALVGTGESADRVEAEIEKFIAARAVMALDRDTFGHEIFSTPEMLRVEHEIGAIARRLTSHVAAAPDQNRVEELIQSGGLNLEQADAVRAATHGGAITIIEGAPGSGKTTLLSAVVQAWQSSGYRVIGTATAWKVAHMMRDDLHIDARATDSWLATANSAGHFLNDRTILLVDEAGLLSSRQMNALLRAVETAGQHGSQPPRLIFTGDRNQLQSVGAGAGLSLLARALDVQKVDQIVRQRQQWAREAVVAFGTGQADAALSAFIERGFVHEAQGAKTTIKTLVDAWCQARVAYPEKSALIVAKTNAQCRAISEEVRARLRAAGLINGADTIVRAATPSGHDVRLALAKGDRVRFLARADFGGAQVINGTEATIESVLHLKGGQLEIAATTEKGRFRFSSAQIADEKGRAKIAHAYVSTIHGVQGLTADRAFCWLTPEMNRHDIYVASSRARDVTQFFVDAKSLDTRIVSERPLNERSAALAISAEVRQNYLARQLARSSLNQTTLDLMLAAPQMFESGAIKRQGNFPLHRPATSSFRHCKVTAAPVDAKLMACPKAGGLGETDSGGWRLVDDWPQQVPVTRNEIDILETYLSAQLDKLLRGVNGSK